MSRAASQSLGAGQRFLLSHQSQDGSWSDWDLPPGPSDGWTTAYVAGRLAVADERLLPASAPAREAAARWLLRGQLDGGGWGYNDRVGADADSTAYAVMFLSAQSVAVPAAACERLLGFQRPDGGFSTYSSQAGFGSWGSSHPDVSAVAARATMAVADRVPPECSASPRAVSLALDRALGYIAGERGPEGTWDSFWWSSPLYATAAALGLLRGAEVRLDAAPTRRALSAIDPENAFERALLLSCRLRTGAGRSSPETARLVQALAAEQLPDGSWPSAPILRLTDRAGGARRGPLFADPRRLFTSATVLAALSEFTATPA